MSDDSPPASIDDAIAAFNRGAYFEAAEMFETASHSATDELKGLIVAFNQVAAAFHLRFERGGRQASINLMSQAMIALDDLKPARAGIDVDIDRLCVELAAYTEEVRATPRDERDGLKHRARIFLERRRAPKINRRTS
ncbi:MAG: hypothetical protein WCD12_15535 [Candidatus Binatus sp.]|uniref:DUF309 domain-containing protein n=1 Tax=Candidatus Binatus sp. TaxID=2811406 RepID=UPI003C708050